MRWTTRSGMHATSDRNVVITENGRSGSVTYREPAGSLAFYWEFGGGDVVTIIQVHDAAWKAQPAWLIGRQAEILRFVADEVIRRKAPGCRAEINQATGEILLRQVGPPPVHVEADVSFVRRLSRVKAALGIIVLILALIFGGVMWFKNKVLVIDPGKGTAVGSSVRTDLHVATLIQTLEPYTPSLNRNHGNDTYRFSLFLVPLDGSGTKLIPIGGGYSSSAISLAKILGSDGRTIWFDVQGIGGVDLKTLALLKPSDVRDPHVPQQGSPFPPSVDTYLSAGFLTGPDSWLGLHSPAELEREFAPKKFVRRVVSANDAKQMRRFHHGALGAPVDDKYHRIRSMTALGTDAYFNAAFLRMDDTSEPLRLTDPDGALMIYTSEPGVKGTLMVARVGTDGTIIWKVDTGIDRFKLAQILPGEKSMAFVGTRPPIPDKVSEPLLVIVESATGKARTHSLWQ
ncbi:MAG: hypothetical protein IPK99_13105 [Flavobacteriales bacterium]|nr:hypothetical protein [Flavobacteriales bacterium]